MALTRELSLIMLFVASVHGSVGPSSNGSLCTESRECLQYQLICQTDEYEVRHYSPTLWVSTDAEAYFMGVGAAMAFRRLFQYITGENEGGYQIDMTAPVLVKIPEETTMWEPAIYTLSFPLPQAYQQNPPQPTNDKLYFTEMPDMDVYVRSYGGWMLSVTSRLQAHQLTKELDRVGAKYNCTHHYGVGYDSPLKLLNRHNEVWYVCEGKPVCTDPQEPTPPHPPRPQTDDPARGAPSSVPSIPSSQSPDAPSVTTANSSSSSQALPMALALSAATTSPSEESTHTNYDISEQTTPSPKEESTSSLLEESTRGTSNISENKTPDTSEQSTQITPNSSEQSVQNLSEKSTQSPIAPSEQSTQANISVDKTPDSSEQSTQNTPDSTEQSTQKFTEKSTQNAPSPLEQSQDTSNSSEERVLTTSSLAEKGTQNTPITTVKSV